jgi:predicted Zn-dependent protease
MYRMRKQGVLLIPVLLLTACAARQPGAPLRPGFNLFSQEQDIQLGREAAAEVRKQVDVVQNSELQSYIAELGSRLSRNPDAGAYPYSFTLVNDPTLNAFALPGGPVFVHTGILAAAENEAQLAGVMAHEISHVALRHGTNQASKANIAQLPAVLAGAAVGQGSTLAQLAQLGIGLGFNSLLLKYSRDAEREADSLGAHLMAQAQYNPIEMARFFEKLEAEGGSRAPDFLSSHPSPGNRVKNVEAEIRTLPASSYTEGTGRLARMKALVSQLPPPRKRS